MKLDWRQHLDNFWYERIPENIRMKGYALRRAYWKIHDLVQPKQRWLTKNIPNNWQDKVTLIPDILFDCIIHFVEQEKCFEQVDYEWSEEHRKFGEELRACYVWAKGREETQARIWKTMPKSERSFDEMFEKMDDGSGNYEYIPDETKSYDELYGEHNRLTKEFEDTDIVWMRWIVENHQDLWV